MRTSLTHLLLAGTGVALAALGIPAAASAAPGSDLSPAQQARVAASNQATITRLIAQASCRDNFGIDLNTGAYDVLGLKAIHPMELPSAANSAKVSVIYTK